MEYMSHKGFYRDDLDDREVTVTIRCLTYNHEKYIADTLEGFVNQKTNFRFEAIVHDDCSTDKTAKIIRKYAEKYPSIIKPIFESENLYSKKNGSLDHVMTNHTRGKYVAYCEGDDYWIDPFKLQKQVDCLDKHPEYSMVCTQCDKYFQTKQKRLYNTKWGKDGIITFNDLILSNHIATLTVVIRNSILDKYQKFIKGAPTWSFGDYPIWLYASSKGDIIKLPESTGVYRILDQSASHISDTTAKLKWAHSSFSMFDYFDDFFKFPKSIKREALFNKCVKYEQLAAITGDEYLKNRISNFYLKNRFYIAWISFIFLCNYPKLPIANTLGTHFALKSPMRYLMKKLNIKR